MSVDLGEATVQVPRMTASEFRAQAEQPARCMSMKLAAEALRPEAWSASEFMAWALWRARTAVTAAGWSESKFAAWAWRSG